MRISTGRGDDGHTDLGNASRVPKTAPRIEAYGTVDELNALVGRLRPVDVGDVETFLADVQQHLFVLQADLANPDAGPEDPTVGPREVAAVERWIEGAEECLPPQESFLLPGGTDAAAALHHACTVCRRAERRVVELGRSDGINPHAVTYVNRLSDALYTAARLVNHRRGYEYEAPSY